jgi:hypothetical protein
MPWSLSSVPAQTISQVRHFLRVHHRRQAGEQENARLRLTRIFHQNAVGPALKPA